jgi:hypothetical protein
VAGEEDAVQPNPSRNAAELNDKEALDRALPEDVPDEAVPTSVGDAVKRGDSQDSEPTQYERLLRAIRTGSLVAFGTWDLPEWTPELPSRPALANVTLVAADLRKALLAARASGEVDPNGIHVMGALIEGILDLKNAELSCPVQFTGCRFTDPLLLSGLKVPLLNLRDCHLHGYIDCTSADISELTLRDVEIEGTRSIGSWNESIAANFVKSRYLALSRVRTKGTIYLQYAHVIGPLYVSASLSGKDNEGNSLRADVIEAGGALFLEIEAQGSVRLGGAKVANQFSMKGARLKGTGPLGNSLVANGIVVGQDLFLDDGFSAAGPIWLRSADIGTLVLAEDEASLPRLGEVIGWRVRDVRGAIRTNRKVAARWLDSQHTSQPWQELAAVYERNGQPADARWIRYRSAVNSTKGTPLPVWTGRQLYRWTTGHGYYPLLALVWLVGIFLLSFALSTRWADDFTTPTTNSIREELSRIEGTPAVQTMKPSMDGPPYPGRVPASWWSESWEVSQFRPAVYALATAFPAAASVQPWSPPDDRWGPTEAFLVLRLFAWVFTALLLAGVTGLLRRQT